MLIDRTSLACVRLRENAVPTIFNGFPSCLLQSLNTDDALAPGNAHVVRISSEGFQNNEMLDNESENEEEKEGDTSEEKNFAEDEEHDLLLEGFAKEIPETGVVTYLVCDANRELSDFTQDYSVALSNNVQLKEASEINKIIQATPLMSKIVQIESNAEKFELSTKAEMSFKISVLENKIDKYHKQYVKGRKKIKTLMQSQRRSAKKIASLKESITVLRQQTYIARAKSEALKKASPALIEILGEQKGQSKDKTFTKRYSLEGCEFANKLYSISPDAYRYVYNYLDKALTTDNTILKKLMPKKKQSNSAEDSSVLSSIGDCINIQDDDGDDFSESEDDHVNELENYM